MQAGARKKASGFVAFLLTPVRARSQVVEKLGARWAVLADGLIAGGTLGLIAALAINVSGEAKLGIFAGLVVLGSFAGLMVGARRKAQPKQEIDTQP